jgi:hypothetical protein
LSRRPRQPSPAFDKEADTINRRGSDVWKRPTLAPAFDLEEFAREKMGAPERRTAPSEVPTEPPPPIDPHSGTREKVAVFDPLEEARRKIFAGDHAGALVLVEARLEDERSDANALELADDCRRQLEKTYVARLGSLERVATLALDPGEIHTLPIDHRAAFLLLHVDGVSTLDMLLDVSGMPRLEALRLLFGFYEEGIVRLD